MTLPPPEKLDIQPVDIQRNGNFLFLTSLLRVRRGWFANHALQRTRPVAVVSNHRVPVHRAVAWSAGGCAESLSLGR